jgi:protein-S-isoprenylcysteine O-methyltransferase Ste14
MLPMVTIFLQMSGWLAFLAGTITLGAWLRSHPDKKNAENTSRILHLLFWIGVVPAAGLGVLYPGLTGFDRELGLSPLPRHPLTLTAGAWGLLMGTYLFIVSNIELGLSGDGAAAFLLTKRLVAANLYNRTRNPMSLGFYLGAVGFGLVVGSTYMTLGALLVVIPVHVFYLKYFEEYELELRLGQTYVKYKRSVPFLLPEWFSHLRQRGGDT